MNYAEFILGPNKLIRTVDSTWECRNIGLLKIMCRVFEMLQNTDILKREYTIRINTADGPSRDNPKNVDNFIEFDTSTSSMDESRLFPDYIFGNWWHIGLVDFDDFSKEISENSGLEKISENKLFWMGNLQGIPQRIKYMNIAQQNQDKIYGDQMHWINFGRTPTKFIPTKDYTKFKYLIDLTGHGCSGRLKLLPFCNRPLFIADRRFWSWSDLLLIKQNKHIKINHDLDNLLEMHNWAEKNNKLVFENSNYLFNWAKENFTFKKACDKAFELVSDSIKKYKKIINVKLKNTTSKFDIVVAHYRENLNWIDSLEHDLIGKIYVYTKSELPINLKNPKVIHKYIPNLGRESNTYLYHCLEHFDQIKNNPQDFTFFVQGNPHGLDDAKIPDWIEEIIISNLKHTYNYRISSPYDFLNKGRCHQWAGNTTPSLYNVKEWCDKFVKKDAVFENIPIFWNACFAVSNSLISISDKNRYQAILDELNTINPECGHYCERLWYYIYNMDNVDNKPIIENCYNFWGGRDARNHHGMIKLKEDGTVGLYRHPNETFWERNGDEIVFLNQFRKPTSIMKKISENEYFGDFLEDINIKHKLIKF
jgi:hypothetical protein